MKNQFRAFVFYLSLLGWLSLVSLNFIGLLYLYWSYKYKNPSYDSRFFLFIQYAVIVLVFIVAALGIINPDKINIKIFTYKIVSPSVFLLCTFSVFMIGFAYIGVLLSRLHINSNVQRKLGVDQEFSANVG
jgi:hypothetical protein